jgi:hypothetical protein
MVHSPFLGRERLAVSFDDQRVVEELHLEVVFLDPGEINHDLDGGRRLVGVRVGSPPGLNEKA